MKGMSGHQRPHHGQSVEWFTPPEILAALGPFDDDPCAPGKTNGLLREWQGRVWLNPPYGPETGIWLERLSQHGNGIALIFARTETKMFFQWVWERSTGLLFLKGRLHFHRADGTRAKANSGAPSVLVAYGDKNAEILQQCKIPGIYFHTAAGFLR